MSAPQPNPAAWEPCPQGALTSVVRTVAIHRKRRQFLRTASYAGALLVGLGLTYGVIQSLLPSGPSGFAAVPARVRCRDVLSQVDNYLAGRVSDDWKAAIERHLNRCESCEERVLALQDQLQNLGRLDSATELEALDGPLLPIPEPGLYPRSKSPLLVQAELASLSW